VDYRSQGGLLGLLKGSPSSEFSSFIDFFLYTDKKIPEKPLGSTRLSGKLNERKNVQMIIPSYPADRNPTYVWAHLCGEENHPAATTQL